MLVQFFNVSKIYPNGVKALDDISLKIERGEFVFLMGHSGAGKSTMTKLLTREEVPTRGQIFMNTRSISRMKKSQVPKMRRGIGMVFQDFKLLDNKTAYENVAFAMEVIGTNPKDIRYRVREVLSQVGLSTKENSFPWQLSGGEQQRVGIARALVNRPLMLIADEPTGNLDRETSIEIMELLYDINRIGTTVIMATHALELVRASRKRVIVLQDGKIAVETNAEAL